MADSNIKIIDKEGREVDYGRCKGIQVIYDSCIRLVQDDDTMVLVNGSVWSEVTITPCEVQSVVV